MKKNGYEVVYDAEHFAGSFTLFDLSAAISTAKDILMEWMMNERSEWDPGASVPTDEQRDSWNHMIGTSTVFVYKRIPGKEEPDEEDVVWDMNDDDLREIGWEEIYDD